MKNPYISVIVPIYNVEKYIERCAISLFNQTIDNIEFIFVDDCSSDNTMEILNNVIKQFEGKMREKYWTVKIKHLPENNGTSITRQTGVEMATGDYVIQCDSDDWIKESMLSEMWNLAKKDDLDVVVCDANILNNKGNYVLHSLNTNDTKEFLYDMLPFNSPWNLWNKLFKRTLYTNNKIFYPPKHMNNGEDMVITLQLFYYCNSMGYIKRPLYQYCQNMGSITNPTNISNIIDNYVQWYSNIFFLYGIFKDKKANKKLIKGIVNIGKNATDNIINKLFSINKSEMYIFHKLFVSIITSSHISLIGNLYFLKFMNLKTLSSIKNRLIAIIGVRSLVSTKN